MYTWWKVRKIGLLSKGFFCLNRQSNRTLFNGWTSKVSNYDDPCPFTVSLKCLKWCIMRPSQAFILKMRRFLLIKSKLTDNVCSVKHFLEAFNENFEKLGKSTICHSGIIRPVSFFIYPWQSFRLSQNTAILLSLTIVTRNVGLS